VRGHGAARAALPLVLTVIDAVGPIPVLPDGGSLDVRGLAAALALGAAGALVGSAFAFAEVSPASANPKIQTANDAFGAAHAKDDMSVATVTAAEAADMINAIEPDS